MANVQEPKEGLLYKNQTMEFSLGVVWKDGTRDYFPFEFGWSPCGSDVTPTPTPVVTATPPPAPEGKCVSLSGWLDKDGIVHLKLIGYPRAGAENVGQVFRFLGNGREPAETWLDLPSTSGYNQITPSNRELLFIDIPPSFPAIYQGKIDGNGTDCQVTIEKTVGTTTTPTTTVTPTATTTATTPTTVNTLALPNTGGLKSGDRETSIGWISIPSIGVGAEVVEGKAENGAMVAPQNGKQVATLNGMYAGHYDTDGLVPAALYDLQKVQPGKKVVVFDGHIYKMYKVTKVTRYFVKNAPLEEIWSIGPDQIKLISCLGKWTATDGFDERLVVTAELIETYSGFTE